MAKRKLAQRGNASRRTDGKQTRSNSTCLSVKDRDRLGRLLTAVRADQYSESETGKKPVSVAFSDEAKALGASLQATLIESGLYEMASGSNGYSEMTECDLAALGKDDKESFIGFLSLVRSDLEAAGIEICAAEGDDSFEAMQARRVKGGKNQWRPTEDDAPAYWGFGYIEHRCLQKLGERQWAQPKARTGVVASPAPVSTADEIRKLGELLKEGLLTKKEFTEQKALLLAKE